MFKRSGIFFSITILSMSICAALGAVGCGDVGQPSSVASPPEQGASPSTDVRQGSVSPANPDIGGRALSDRTAPWRTKAMSDEERIAAIEARYAERASLNPHGSITGHVVDPGGSPVAGVKIHVAAMGAPEGATYPGSMEATTDSNGGFTLSSVDLGPQVVSFEHDKYVFKQEIDVTYLSEEHSMDVTLLPRSEPQRFNVVQGATLKSGFVTARFPPSVLVYKDDKKPAVGDVDVTITPIDPRHQVDMIAAPARLEGITADGRPTTLTSFGMVEVEMKQGPRELEVKNGATVRVDFSVDGLMDVHAGDKVPMWHHDRTTGYWSQQRDLYASVAPDSAGKLVASAELPHFSSWNVDNITDSICTSFVIRRLMEPNTNYLPKSVRVFGTDANGNCALDANGNCTATWTMVPYPRTLDVNGSAFTFNAPSGYWGKNRYFKIVGKKLGGAVESLLVRFPDTEASVVSAMHLNNYLIQKSGQSDGAGSATVGNWCGPLPAGWSFPKAQSFSLLTVGGDQIQYSTAGSIGGKPMSEWRMPFTYALRMPGTTFVEGAAQIALNNIVVNPNDADGDGILDPFDNCPQRPNPFQNNSSPNDGKGDACEDYCYVDPASPNASWYDWDHDGLDDWCDNNPETPNATQLDNVVYDF